MPKYSCKRHILCIVRVKLIKNAENISYLFSLLCPIMPSMIMPNYAPYKASSRPTFCPTYIPLFQKITKLQSMTNLKKASQYLLEKFWGLMVRYPDAFQTSPKLSSPKFPLAPLICYNLSD